MTAITATLVAEHGITDDEYKTIIEILGREPNLTELGVFSVMWSEHCSYKSSKKWLKTLPTEAPWVICGPGENAGVVDIGDGQAAVFKMESHNHPSYIDPYQGAATGVGGILRDVFTMGARPISNLNALRFGNPNHPKTKHLVSGVVEGIGGYGNCVGVPTVGGECNFHPSYDGNVLVNAMTVGLAQTDKIFYSVAKGVGNPVVYVGSKTGRDGIHGATMASNEFNSDAEGKRPTVQVGDPFTEKLLIEACLELMATNTIIAIQDMGAAGLTSSSFEMASKGGLGVELNLDNVPARETGMTPYEFLLSESQERMLMILRTGQEKVAQNIFNKWELDFSVIGCLTDTGRMVIREEGEVVVDLPIDPLAQASPEYDRPWVKTKIQSVIIPDEVPQPKSLIQTLKVLMGSPDLCSKRWIWEQYDYLVMGDTLQRPGGDAAVVRIQNTKKAIAMTTDCTPRYCLADPVEGGKQPVAEAWRNLTAVGAQPLAITDNLNFGNPERPEIMGQFVGAIEGIREACIVLNFPVVSGNVSLYNETNGGAILPTPTIGGVGLLADHTKSVGIGFPSEGETIYLLGESKGHLGQSLYLREVEDREEGMPPQVDLVAERVIGDLVRAQIQKDVISACHDISDGGLLIACAEMALASMIGIVFADLDNSTPAHAYLFGEEQGRYLVTCKDPGSFLLSLKEVGVPVKIIGQTGGNTIDIGGESISLLELKEVHESWFPNLMSK